MTLKNGGPEMMNRKLSIKEVLLIGLTFLLLLVGHYAAIIPGRRWVLVLALFSGYYFVVCTIFLLVLPKLDSFIKAVIASVFIPILAIYIALSVGLSLDRGPLSVLKGTFLEITKVVREIFGVYLEEGSGWLASIAILAIWYIRGKFLKPML
jgi:hypothetical protein